MPAMAAPCTASAPPPTRSMLAVALLLVVVLAGQPPPAASAPHDAAQQTPRPVASHNPLPGDVDYASEAVVVFGSGRHLAASAHRRILDVLHGRGPVTVRLASGKERSFASGRAYMAAARSAELHGARFVVPAETFPCDVVEDVVETELALRTQMLLPGGAHVPLVHYVEGVLPQDQLYHHQHHHDEDHQDGVRYPGSNPYQQQPLFHKQPAVYDWMAPFAADVPEAELQVVLGGSQRLSLRVHDAVLRSLRAEAPVQLDLTNGRSVTVASYEELTAKMLDPRFVGARVCLEDDVKVPVETYRAVASAHKHKGVYVVDHEDHRMRYADYARRRDADDKKTHSPAEEEEEQTSERTNRLHDDGGRGDDE